MESAKEDTNDGVRGPFSATKLWNNLVSQLKTSVHVKRRRWRMKVYLDAFTGIEAIDRLHGCLKDNPNFGPSVSRQQAHQLCQKFLENGVIEDVRGKEFNAEFEDNGHLYRFVSIRHSPFKATRSRRRNLTVTVGKEISAIMSAFFSKDNLHENRLPPTLQEVQENPFSEAQSQSNCDSLSSEQLQTQNYNTSAGKTKTQFHAGDFTNGMHMEQKLGPERLKSAEKIIRPPLKKKQTTCSESALTEQKRIKDTKMTPMKRGFSSVLTAPFTPAPSRTPLVNKLNVLRSVKSESKMEGINRNFQRKKKSVAGQVIMNTLTMEDQKSCRNLLQQEIEQVWHSIAVTRLKRLLEIEESENLHVSSGFCTAWVLKNFQQQRICKAHEVLPQWVVNAMKCLLNWSNESHPEFLNHLPCYRGFERDVFRAIIEYFDDRNEPLVHQQVLPLFLRSAGFIAQSKSISLRPVQYCCLLLNPCHRKILQVLLKFMIRLSQNLQVVLSDDLPTRELVIQSFSKSIFNLTGDMDAIRMLFFMMENFPTCFKNPEGLEYQVEQRILFLKNCRGNEFKCVQPLAQCPVTFCKQVTLQEYEEQRRLVSQSALKDLLNQIVNDQMIDEKDRTKKLRKFQKSHPDLYAAEFTGNKLPTSNKKSVMRPQTVLTHL